MYKSDSKRTIFLFLLLQTSLIELRNTNYVLEENYRKQKSGKLYNLLLKSGVNDMITYFRPIRINLTNLEN
jgi:hypothetical protein